VSFLPGPHGAPQIFSGKVGGFTISGTRTAAAPEAVTGTIRLADHSIELPAGFTGSGTYAVTDVGKRAHDFSLARLPGSGSLGSLFACIGSSFGKGRPIDGCPGTLVGGVSTIRPGATAYLIIHLRAGHYGYISTGGDGRDYAAGLRGTVVVS
jgi:hypothetical protein